MRKLAFFAFLGLFLAYSLGVSSAAAQTASTAIVLGTVTDPGGAVVPDAKVELTNTETNETKSMMTNSVGQYTFPNVVPGTYTLKFTKQGFNTTTVANFKVDVSKSYTFDMKLQIRSTNEVVEVTAEAKAELQTTDAVVGNVVGGTVLLHLPTLNRDAGELMTLQPGSTPYDSGQTGFGDTGGTIAGARSDQNAFNLDGIDITDNVIAGGGVQTPIIPIGVEEVEEFRVGLTNNNATFERASGGQVNLINKTAGNSYHGTVYWYHLNSALSANQWDLNHTPNADTGKPFTAKPKQHENRGGVSFGGPIRKNKTFVSGNYEIHRFPRVIQIERIVPTDTLRNGTLVFNGTQYDLATSTACGNGTQACDPRGVGISPTVKQLWGLLPPGNDPNVGDKVNTLGFRTTVPAPEIEDSVKFKLDHEITEKIHFLGRYFYHRDLTPPIGGQVDLRGGKATTPSDSNIRGDGFISGLDWQFRPNLTDTFRAGWIRSRQDFTVIRPRVSAAQLALPGTDSSLGPVALAPGLAQGADAFLDAPVDVDTQKARHQAIYDSNKQYVDYLTWVKGKHTVVGGTDIRWLPTIHDRDDKVVGSLNSLVALLDADVSNFLTIPAANRPPGLSASDAQRWDRFYAASLGLIDNVGILAVRDGNLQPRPLGASLISKDTLRSYNFYFQDTWRMAPSLTLTYGLGYGWQTTPHELNQQQTFIVNHDSGDQIISGLDYIDQKAKAAANGDFYNPTLAYLPIAKSGHSDVFSVDYGDWAPRVSAAWSPAFRTGVLGRMFGEKKAVIRGGYGIAYDRVNTVQSVIIPMLGVGFAQTINVALPNCNASGTPGTNCGVDGTAGGSIFRVGVDGNIPVPPAPTALSSPVVPATGFSELLSFQNDSNFKVGRSHMIDFTVQRSLPSQMILELGYIGRLGRNLPNSINFNSSPYMFKDKTSGQSFAQAFDAVATALRSGGTPADQPSALNSSGFTNGNVTSLFLLIDAFRGALGLPTFNNQQVLELFMRTTGDISNYHAGFVALRNNNWRGLYFDLNYTYSKSLDQVGAVQNDARYYTSSFNRHLDYGPSFFDRPHIFNATFNYELPFGKGRLGGGYAPLRKLLGGWYVAGIIRAASGIPELANESNQSFGGGLIFGTFNGAIPTVPVSSLGGGSPHSVPCSSGAGSSGNSCNGGTGTGLNYFGDPATVINKFRRVLLASDTNSGRDSPLRGLPYKDFDARVGKSTGITEKVKVEYSFDFFNAFNHVNFLDPAFDLTNPATFGVINTQYIPANRISGSRWIQFGLRVSF
ncbi:MAG: hypothetical protein AUG07_08980 [Acidobacteria bacterium 13_1_20CM_2_60_10]|nr:MAG: hypothetical protein AUG07_08980 [Acidobacteria bacterium 13_1_20CM_2_60_10]